MWPAFFPRSQWWKWSGGRGGVGRMCRKGNTQSLAWTSRQGPFRRAPAFTARWICLLDCTSDFVWRWQNSVVVLPNCRSITFGKERQAGLLRFHLTIPTWHRVFWPTDWLLDAIFAGLRWLFWLVLLSPDPGGRTDFPAHCRLHRYHPEKGKSSD